MLSALRETFKCILRSSGSSELGVRVNVSPMMSSWSLQLLFPGPQSDTL